MGLYKAFPLKIVKYGSFQKYLQHHIFRISSETFSMNWVKSYNFLAKYKQKGEYRLNPHNSYLRHTIGAQNGPHYYIHHFTMSGTDEQQYISLQSCFQMTYHAEQWGLAWTWWCQHLLHFSSKIFFSLFVVEVLISCLFYMEVIFY